MGDEERGRRHDSSAKEIQFADSPYRVASNHPRVFGSSRYCHVLQDLRGGYVHFSTSLPLFLLQCLKPPDRSCIRLELTVQRVSTLLEEGDQ